jgi:hypothetical protein
VIIAAQWWHCICCGRLKMICSRTSPSCIHEPDEPEHAGVLAELLPR